MSAWMIEKKMSKNTFLEGLLEVCQDKCFILNEIFIFFILYYLEFVNICKRGEFNVSK